MHRVTKIATCCYCGTRATLVLAGDAHHHELACRSCGAPLHRLKALPRNKIQQTPVPPTRRAPPPHVPQPSRPPRKRKRRKTLARRMLSEAVDLLEDIFD